MRLFTAGRCRMELGDAAYVMGILNVTPDSFSDGGKYFSLKDAEQHALEMQEMGADMIDVGAQSTRPGWVQVSPEEELQRLLPVLDILACRVGVPVSVDTFYPQVAKQALAHGASIINDVTGFADPDMVQTTAGTDCGCIVMYPRGEEEGDIIGQLNRFFAGKRRELEDAGIEKSRICFDPGIGFGKTYEQNLEILANTAEIDTGGCALLMAASRKRVIGQPCGNPPFEQRMPGTLAAHSISVYSGADLVRAHDVAEAVQAAKVAAAIRRAKHG